MLLLVLNVYIASLDFDVTIASLFRSNLIVKTFQRKFHYVSKSMHQSVELMA